MKQNKSKAVKSDIDPATLRQIEEEALKRSGGDAALWYHYRAIFEGEYRQRQTCKETWVGWRKTTLLPQFKTVEVSVISGWRKYVENTLRIPRQATAKRTHLQPSAAVRASTLYLAKNQQADDYAINQAIIFDACRRAKNDAEIAHLLIERADSIQTFAASGDTNFFRHLGRLLGTQKSSDLEEYQYAEYLLSHWLTDFLWLMPERVAADLVEKRQQRKTPKTARESDKALRHLKDTKRKYQLRSHQPTIVAQIDSKDNLVLTAPGRALLNSL
jgi:hypothetical protein